MHWFWRATIAVGVGAVFSVSVYLIRTAMIRPLPYNPLIIQATASMIIVFAQVITLGTYGMLTRAYGPRVVDCETRCRKCGYILRGISEPRCPECGERI